MPGVGGLLISTLASAALRLVHNSNYRIPQLDETPTFMISKVKTVLPSAVSLLTRHSATLLLISITPP